jgi:hypothetical protein
MDGCCCRAMRALTSIYLNPRTDVTPRKAHVAYLSAARTTSRPPQVAVTDRAWQHPMQQLQQPSQLICVLPHLRG